MSNRRNNPAFSNSSVWTGPKQKVSISRTTALAGSVRAIYILMYFVAVCSEQELEMTKFCGSEVPIKCPLPRIEQYIYTLRSQD